MTIVAIIALILLLIGVYDLIQKKHAILHNFPIIGHFRYLLETVGPELRQYIVTGNNEERPFNRDQRRWVYASAKKENNYFGFGTDEDLDHQSHYLIIKHASFPLTPPHQGEPSYQPDYPLPMRKVMGAKRGRAKAFRPASIVNISGMSYGSLSAQAIQALNQGAKLAGCLHNTGEGGISSHHLQGGELIWQIGTGYFGCRDKRGRFDLEMLRDKVERYPVRALEIKLSQGAKPGAGGILPKSKITKEIAEIRGISLGQDCLSPSHHHSFQNEDELLDFVETLSEATGLPVGIKTAVGELSFFENLATLMESGTRGVDFITIDGGEGGTGAGPLVFTDHIALPFKVAFPSVYQVFLRHNLNQDIVFLGSGKLGWPESALLAMALGCDGLQIARSAMLAIGCIQAQRCHTGHCPTGVATQNKWLTRGLNPEDKAHRFSNYLISLRKELTQVAYACGVTHPADIPQRQFAILNDALLERPLAEVFGYEI